MYEVIQMIKFTKPKILTSAKSQTSSGEVKFTKQPYNLSDKDQGKEIR